MMSPCLLLSFVPSFGKNIYGDKGEIVLFLRCPHNAVSVYTFSGDIVLVYVHEKNIPLPHIPFYYILVLKIL